MRAFSSQVLLLKSLATFLFFFYLYLIKNQESTSRYNCVLLPLVVYMWKVSSDLNIAKVELCVRAPLLFYTAIKN